MVDFYSWDSRLLALRYTLSLRYDYEMNMIYDRYDYNEQLITIFAAILIHFVDRVLNYTIISCIMLVLY